MSEENDPESKTEEASEKKIRDTIESGKIPVSRDVITAAGIFAFLVWISFLLKSKTLEITEGLALLVANVGTLPLRSGKEVGRYIDVVNLEIARFLVAPIVLFVIFGLAASFGQGAPRLVTDRIQPDWARISPLAGWKRIFSVVGLIEIGKSATKIAIVAGAVALAGIRDQTALSDAMRTDPSQTPQVALQLIIHLTSVVALAVGVLAVADFMWTRHSWRRDLRMSREELKEEFKQAEGDPLVKARLRSLAMDRSRRRMMAAVPKASFVIANPTHYAIALRYVREEGGAPLVVAKGTDLIALKIREVAEKNSIPVLERKELTRVMYDIVEVDQMIPAEFYRPIAELIHFLGTVRPRP